jgi:lysosomal acid lipase/cholesteryl ester hydrolase
MSPPGLTSGIVDSFVKSSPEVLCLLFGRRALLSSATMWQALLYPPIFVRFIDMSLAFLFGWKTHNIDPHQKLAAYPHLYSFTSTKSVVHWFQIIRNGKFQMYDDEVQAPWSVSDGARFYKVPRFPTRNIKTPIVMIYGGSDSLVDINIMLKELPKHTVAREVPHYEHLDFLWAHDVETEVFPHVFEALNKYTEPGGADSQSRFLESGKTYAEKVAHIPSPSEDETSGGITRKHTENVRTASDAVPRSPTSPSVKPRSRGMVLQSSSPAGSGSHMTNHTTTSRPEGWWSSDDVAGTEPSTPISSKTPPPTDNSHLQSGSANHEVRRKVSRNSIESFGERGITFGKAGVVGGVNMDDAVGAAVGVTGDGKKRKKRRKE